MKKGRRIPSDQSTTRAQRTVSTDESDHRKVVVKLLRMIARLCTVLDDTTPEDVLSFSDIMDSYSITAAEIGVTQKEIVEWAITTEANRAQGVPG